MLNLSTRWGVRNQHHAPAASTLGMGQGTHHRRELGVSHCRSGWEWKRETPLPLPAFIHWDCPAHSESLR